MGLINQRAPLVPDFATSFLKAKLFPSASGHKVNSWPRLPLRPSLFHNAWLCCDTDKGTTVIFYEVFFMSQQRQVPLAWKGEGRAAAVVWSRVRLLRAASWAAAVSMQGGMAMRQAQTVLLPTLSSPSTWIIVK